MEKESITHASKQSPVSQKSTSQGSLVVVFKYVVIGMGIIGIGYLIVLVGYLFIR